MTTMRPGRLFVLFTFFALAMLAASRNACAQFDFSWNVANGDFNVGANWSPVGPPIDGSIAEVSNGGTANLASGAYNLTAFEVAAGAGTTGTFNATGGELTAGEIRFGELGTATATVNNATLNAGGNSLFVGGEDETGTGTLNLGGATALITSGDDFILGRTGTGTLNMTGGRMQGGFTVVGKFGTGTWNQSGGVYEARNDLEIGDGGMSAETDIQGPRTGTINLTGGVIHTNGHVAIGNRVGTGVVNVSGGAVDATGAATSNIYIGRGSDTSFDPGAGGPTTMRVTGGSSVIVASGGFDMNSSGIASSSTLIAEITGAAHTTIKVVGDANIANGALKVELNGFTPAAENSWTLIEAGADISAELTAIDNQVAAGGFPALTHVDGANVGSIMGTFASTNFTAATLPSGLQWKVNYDTNKVVLSITQELTADFNDDQKVDGADLMKWEGDFGPTNAGSTADADTDSDGADFLTWQRQSGLPTLGVSAVPEPASALLVALGAMIAPWAARSRRRCER